MTMTMILSPGALALVMSCVMGGVMGVILALFAGGKSSKVGDEMYIGGESERVLRKPLPSAVALYWGLVKRAMGKLYITLRDVVHSGRLNEWCAYMASWFLLLLLISIVVAVSIASVYSGW